MFGYIRRNRAKVVVESTLPSLREGIQALSQVDRAATLALVNAMLEVASDQWGETVMRAPNRLDAGVAAAAVLTLASHHARLVREGLGQMEDRGMDDVGYAQAMRETRATEVLIVTLGSRFVEGGKEDLSVAWRLLWNARGAAPEAAEALGQYARHARVEALPRSRRRLQGTPPAELVRLAGVLPLFLRPRSAKPATAKPATAKASGAGGAAASGGGPKGAAKMAPKMAPNAPPKAGPKASSQASSQAPSKASPAPKAGRPGPAPGARPGTARARGGDAR